jgi:trans-2,3-dihydro-3-hydroxyanthranilate isomerase
MQYQYYLIDAFAHEPFQGAPTVVFPEADGLTEQQMQLIAREMNQTETVFLFASTSEAVQMKIYTPEKEVDFSGHPVISASYVLALDGKISAGKSQLKTNAGVVDINIIKQADDIEKITFSSKSVGRFDDFVPSAKELAEILHLDARDLDVHDHKPMISSYGDDYLIIPVKSAEALLKARFSTDKWIMSFVATLAKQVLLFTVNKEDEAVDFNARLLGKGIAESDDPPIGTAVPAFAAYIFSACTDGSYKAVLQRGGGARRKSLLEVEAIHSNGKVEQVSVGGSAVLMGKGYLMVN